MPEDRYFSMPSTVEGAEVLRNFALNWRPCVLSLCQVPLAVSHSPAEIACRMANRRDHVPVAAGLDPQDAKAVLLIVEGHPFNEASKNFGVIVVRLHRGDKCGKGGSSSVWPSISMTN